MNKSENDITFFRVHTQKILILYQARTTDYGLSEKPDPHAAYEFYLTSHSNPAGPVLYLEHYKCYLFCL